MGSAILKEKLKIKYKLKTGIITMKKNRLIVLTLLLSMLTFVSYGQGKVTRPPILKSSFGLKAGVNLSTITKGQSNIDFSPGMNTGFHVGAVVNLHFGYQNEGSPVGTGLFGIQPELLYSMQGFAVDGDKVNFSYISLPVMAKFYVAQGFNIEVGPYFSYLISASPGSTVISGTQIDISGLKDGLDVGAGVGLGYETKTGLTVGARYNIGFLEMDKNLQWKNSVIAISVGWLF